MIGLVILFVLIVVCIGIIWLMTSRHTELDDVLRERVDYDVWLRRNSMSEEKERQVQKDKDVLDHDKRMMELKKEVDKLEEILKGNKK